MNEIVFSYRRADSPALTGNLFDHLARAFGKDAIFSDVGRIPHGVDLEDYLDQIVAGCKVVLVIIGPQWLSLADDQGPLLYQVDDPARITIEAALHWRKSIIPVLLDDASMPATIALPTTIQFLASRNAARVGGDQDFARDINALLDAVAAAGVQRRVHGYIANPPKAGLGRVAPRVNIALVFVALGVVAALVVAILGYNALVRAFPGYLTTGPHVALTNFCDAIQERNYNAAYADMTTNLQATVGSPASLPTSLVTDLFGASVTVTGCQPFSSWPDDAFYHESGNTADDLVEFTIIQSDEFGGAPETTETTTNKEVFFLNVNGVWKLDRIQDQ
jgi:hypothetical protein